MGERRKLMRFDLRVPAKVEFRLDGGRRNALSSTTRDISSCGAYVLTEQPLPEGIVVRLEVLLSTELLNRVLGEKRQARVSVQGRVVRTDAGGMAIAFDGPYKISSGQRPD